MAQTFEDITLNVVERFLQNILFIDDNAYSDNKENAFNAQEISSIFAKKGKLCTIYAPASTKDLNNCASLFAKSDVIVLDWYLNLITEQQASSDDEADAESEEPRGVYTLNLIKYIVKDASNKKLKLIIIYTGDGTKLIDITNEIYHEISSYGQFNISENNCQVFSSNISILIRAKSNGEGENQLKYNKNLQSKIIDYRDLPDTIIKEFSRQVNGILPNYALSAITSIREQTSKILGVYSDKIDYAFLGHRVLLQNQNDAQHLLQKIFGESLSDLIFCTNTDMEKWISLWVDGKFQEPKKVNIGAKEIVVTKDILKELLTDTAETYHDKTTRIFKGILSKKEAENNSTCLFSTDEAIANSSNVRFAIITHHKNIFGTKSERPILTLGTVVSFGKNYYVCIQQRCDSVRIKEERRFLFLPLTNTKSDIHIQIDKDCHQNVSYSSYEIKTIIFKPQDGEDCIFAKPVKTTDEKIKYVFESKYGETLEWILELKELHAQRIVDSYCSKLSRVGINESEWLRLLQ